MNIRYFGHSAVELSGGDHTVLIDPFIDDNPAATVSSAELEASHILITHAHGDHVGDAVSIARRTGATVVSIVEVADWMEAQGVESFGMNMGAAFPFPFGSVRLTPAWHSSSFADGTYGGMPTGLVIEMGGKRIYHAGDTALFSDMSLIGDLGIDLAFLPIGGLFTMGPNEAVRAAKLLRARVVVPVHYNTFPPIEQDAQAFAEMLQREGAGEGLILAPGETAEI